MGPDDDAGRAAADALESATCDWLALTGVLIGGSVLAFAVPALWLDWQPAQALAQPWRAVTAAWVHWSEQHLGANLLAALVVGAYGRAAQLPRTQAWAWAAAWPLTHLGLLAKPDLLHYGGLSGVLHAGVAIVCLHLVLCTQGRRRFIGAGVALGLVVKLVSEKPWGAALQNSPDWDIAVAPLAHATGAVAGLLCGLVAWAWARREARRRVVPPAAVGGATCTANRATDALQAHD